MSGILDDLRDLVTVVVPTHRRANLLSRWLRVHRNLGLRVIVADSSPEDSRTSLEGFIDEDLIWHPGGLEVYPKKMLAALERADTNLVIVAPDDDFLMSECLRVSATNMAREMRLSASMGEFITLIPGARPTLIPSRSNRGADGPCVERIQSVGGSFLYSVQRRSNLRDFFEIVDQSRILSSGLPSSGVVDAAHSWFMACLGDIEVVQRPYLLRSYDRHSQNAAGDRSSLFFSEEVSEFFELVLDRVLERVHAGDDQSCDPGLLREAFWTTARKDLAGQIVFSSVESKRSMAFSRRLTKRFHFLGSSYFYLMEAKKWLSTTDRTLIKEARTSLEWKAIRNEI